ncbi:hypothetical protein cypCar_00029057, partial [Cyprinus carpio]
MGTDQFQSQKKINCAFCDKSEENKITGTLSSKGNIAAHQNCLLYASAIYCKLSPTYDDLFGFDVEDVKKELRRGKRLLCHYCKKNGATAGCEVKHCKRSYHYPCAIEDRATINEDHFILFCELHDPKSKKENDDDTESMYAPVQSDTEDFTPPNQNNSSTPDPEHKRPGAKPSPSTTGSLNLTSAQKACGSADNPGELHGRSKGYPYMYRASTFQSLGVGTPRRGKNKRILDSDDESPTSSGRVAAPGVLDLEDSMLQKQPK